MIKNDHVLQALCKKGNKKLYSLARFAKYTSTEKDASSLKLL